MKTDRLYLIDLVRLHGFIAILMFHFYSAVYWVEWDSSVTHGYLFDHLTWYPRLASFSGFTMLGIFCFLGGWRGTRITWRPLLGLFVVGCLLLMMTQSGEPFQTLIWEWDIYHFLIVTLGTLLALQISRTIALIAGVVGLLMTWIPFWQWDWTDTWGPLAQQALIGSCSPEGGGDWPLLPWIGFAWASYAFGVWQRFHAMSSHREGLLWLPLLGLSLIWWGPFFRTPVGPEFSCHVFRQPPLIFWSHMIWIVFLIRLSSYEPLNNGLARHQWMRRISGWRINRQFGRAYFVHLFLLGIATLAADDLRKSPLTYDIFWLSILPVTEFILRGIESVNRRLEGKVR